MLGKTEDHWSHCVREDRGSLESSCLGRQRIIGVIVFGKTEDHWSHCVWEDRGSLESLC